MYSRGKNKGQEKVGIRSTPDMYPQGYFKPKPCRECKELFEPRAPCHMYCSGDCSSIGMSRKYLMKAYGITYEEYLELFNKNSGRCYICNSDGFRIDPNQRLKLAVDHCHETGVVRGMLCHNCNRGLGLFQDSPEFLKTAAAYLERVTTTSSEGTPKQVEAHSTLTVKTEGEDIV